MIDEGLPAMQERQNPISSLLPAPRPHWTQEPQLFCYEPQARALRDLLRELLGDHFEARRLHTVDRHGERMQGIRNGIFVIIEGHCEPVPMCLVHMIASMGFTVWSHNDGYCRARHAEDQARREQRVCSHHRMTLQCPICDYDRRTDTRVTLRPEDV